MKTTFAFYLLHTLWVIRPPQDYREEKISGQLQQLEEMLAQHEYQSVIDQGIRFQDRFEPSPAVAYEVALAARLMGNVDLAFQYYDRVIELDPQHAAARYDRGEIFLLTLGDVESAKADFRIAAEMVPEHWGVYYRLAHIAGYELDMQALEANLDLAVAHGLDFQVLVQDPQWRQWAKHSTIGPVLKMVFLRYTTESVWREMERAP